MEWRLAQSGADATICEFVDGPLDGWTRIIPLYAQEIYGMLDEGCTWNRYRRVGLKLFVWSERI